MVECMSSCWHQADQRSRRRGANAVAARDAPWSEMTDLIASTLRVPHLLENLGPQRHAPAGDIAKGTVYLMGNHTIAERMYRHYPAVMFLIPVRRPSRATSDLRSQSAPTRP
jgi:hypothetical protein